MERKVHSENSHVVSILEAEILGKRHMIFEVKPDESLDIENPYSRHPNT